MDILILHRGRISTNRTKKQCDEIANIKFRFLFVVLQR